MEPFVKWVGGKRQLLNQIKIRLPKEFNNYYEPFVGGGAVVFAITPKKAAINDINKALINAYLSIKNNPLELINLLEKFDEKSIDKNAYLIYRDKYNKKILSDIYDLETAALFIFLNKHCFNGLYRVNSKGLFNVPFNNKQFTKSFNRENILNISDFLQNVNIHNDDFSEILSNAQKGDFVFFDSPYAPLNDNTFDSYTKTGFSKSEHIRLSELFKKLHHKGCYLMLTNHNTELINELYKDFNIETFSVKRLVNCKADKRLGKEVIITNYDWRK